MTSKSLALDAPITAFPALDAPSIELRPARWLDRFRRHALQQRLERAVVDAPCVVLGTQAIPFEALDQRRRLLDALAERVGVAITLVTRGGLDDADEIARLARLDLDHAVTVDVLLDAPASADRFAALRAVERFAELGVAVRLSLGSLGDSAAEIAPLVDEAARRGVLDVVAHGDPGDDRRRVELYRLRLRHDLPRARPGRG